MRSELKIRKGLVECPRLGQTSVAVCRQCPDFKRVEAGVVCNAALGVTSANWWGTVLLSAASPLIARREHG